MADNDAKAPRAAKPAAARFQVQIYYEDTDHSGVVYHASTGTAS